MPVTNRPCSQAGCDIMLAQGQWRSAGLRDRKGAMKRRSTFLQALRAEARATLHALLLLLLIPVFHPVAEAIAVENGTASVICATFGDTNADPLALADDLPDCLACAMAAAAVPPDGTPDPHCVLGVRIEPMGKNTPHLAEHSFSGLPPARGPPSLA
jgi:hypothetical protein